MASALADSEELPGAAPPPPPCRWLWAVDVMDELLFTLHPQRSTYATGAQGLLHWLASGTRTCLVCRVKAGALTLRYPRPEAAVCDGEPGGALPWRPGRLLAICCCGMAMCMPAWDIMAGML